ncbi:hypothetical protein Tco_0365369 [Tanacetum coccineum]
MDVDTVVTPSNVKKVESNHESVDVKNNGDAVEPKTVRKNSFRPPVIKDWNSDDDSEVEFIPNVKDKTVRPSTEKIKFIKQPITESSTRKRVIDSGNQTNGIARTKDNIVAGQAEKKTEPEKEYILTPFCTTDPLISYGPKDSEEDVGMKHTEKKQTNSTNSFNTFGTPVSAVGPSFTNDEASNAFEEHLFEQFSPFKNAFTLPDVPNVSLMDDNTRIFAGAYDDEDVWTG